MDAEASTFGWALRVNGSCLDIEEDCGPTLEPYEVCCPGGSYCPHAYNVACCPSESNCTEALQAQPHCANSTWDLYINGGYFCCEHGTTGYATSSGSNGCGSPDYELGPDETKLPIVSTAPAALTSTSTSTPSPTSSAPATTSTQSSQSSGGSSSSDAGPIAGGVIGGVAGAALIVALVWFLFRMRRRQQQQQPQPVGMAPMPEHFGKVAYPPPPPVEMEAHRFAELGGDAGMVTELPGHYGR
ncbi:hypothetical protein BDW62DRAFT_52212 [Aspergillus aurantiobrunneus]